MNLLSASSDDSSNAVLSTSRSIELEDEEDESIVYRKVTDNDKKTSKIWNHFSEATHSENNRRIFCLIEGCRYHTAFSGSTTRGFEHLKKVHKIDLKDENETNNKKSCSKEEDADLTTLLVMFIITSGKINFYCASSKIINYNSIFEGLSFERLRINI